MKTTWLCATSRSDNQHPGRWIRMQKLCFHHYRADLDNNNLSTLAFSLLTNKYFCCMCRTIISDCSCASLLQDCHVLTFSSTGSVSDHLVLHPQLATGNFIIKAIWLPGSQTELAIITADFVKARSNKTLFLIYLASLLLNEKYLWLCVIICPTCCMWNEHCWTCHTHPYRLLFFFFF